MVFCMSETMSFWKIKKIVHVVFMSFLDPKHVGWKNTLSTHCTKSKEQSAVFPDAVGNDFCSRLRGPNVGTFWPAVGSRKRVVFEDLQSYSSRFWFWPKISFGHSKSKNFAAWRRHYYLICALMNRRKRKCGLCERAPGYLVRGEDGKGKIQ